MTGAQPSLTTPRLLLRPFTPEDAPAVRTLAGDPDVASTTANIPHPYPEGMAAEWISSHRKKFDDGTGVIYAVTRKRAVDLIGAIGLILDRPDNSAEMGYWIGKPFWGLGFATEAATALLEYGFTVLLLGRIHAHHMTRNPASGRVLEKIGMTPGAGTGQIARMSGEIVEVRACSMLLSEFQSRSARVSPGPEPGRGGEG